MLVIELFRWWYGPGWHGQMQRIGKRIGHVSEAFSVAILIRTLFAPWRRIITYPGASLNDHFRAGVDNAVSRFIGFLVRVLALTAAGFMLLGFALGGLIEVILWPLLPVLAVGLLVWGII